MTSSQRGNRLIHIFGMIHKTPNFYCTTQFTDQVSLVNPLLLYQEETKTSHSCPGTCLTYVLVTQNYYYQTKKPWTWIPPSLTLPKILYYEKIVLTGSNGLNRILPSGPLTDKPRTQDEVKYFGLQTMSIHNHYSWSISLYVTSVSNQTIICFLLFLIWVMETIL